MPFLEDQGASCATSVALENAAEFGGDPDEMALAGASGGAIAAAQVAIADDPPGEAYCLVPAEPVEPRAVVMWEGDWILGPWWDNALEANPSFYEDEWVLNELDADLESTWHVMAGLPERVGRYRLAVNDPFGTGDECGRPLNGEPGFEPIPPGTMCRFLELRDSTGDLRRDFDRLGFYDDGWLTITESSVLLADRLDAAGVDHTLTIIGGGTHDDMTLEGQEAYIDLIVNG
jgi:acetyl esterase/lipase